MTAPLSAIVDAIASEQPVLTELQIDADTAVQELANVYKGVGYVTNSIAAKCVKHGKTALLGAMDPAVASASATALALLAQVWPSFSDAPFPDMPDEPVEDVK